MADVKILQKIIFSGTMQLDSPLSIGSGTEAKDRRNEADIHVLKSRNARLFPEHRWPGFYETGLPNRIGMQQTNCSALSQKMRALKPMYRARLRFTMLYWKTRPLCYGTG